MDMNRCVQLNMECAAICNACGQLMSIESEKVPAVAKICAEMCRACADECSRYDHPHCKVCAEACHRCAELCTFELI
jgi:hypothetical protein